MCYKLINHGIALVATLCMVTCLYMHDIHKTHEGRVILPSHPVSCPLDQYFVLSILALWFAIDMIWLVIVCHQITYHSFFYMYGLLHNCEYPQLYRHLMS